MDSVDPPHLVVTRRQQRRAIRAEVVSSMHDDCTISINGVAAFLQRSYPDFTLEEVALIVATEVFRRGGNTIPSYLPKTGLRID